MDVVSIWVIAAISIVAGFACYAADLIGRSLGKKRLTLFGLRPRHTAAITVFFAGLLLVPATVGVISLASSDVRVWLSEGRLAVKERDVKVRQLRDKTKEYDALVKQSEAEAKRLKSAQADLEQATKALAEARKAETSVRSQVKQLGSELAALKNRVAGELKKYADLQARYDTLDTSAKQLVKQSQEYRENIVRLDQEIRQKNTEIKTKSAELEAAQSQVREAETKKSEAEKDLKIAQDAYEQAKENFAKEKEQAQRELERVRQQVDEQKGEVTKYQQIANLLRENADAARTRPMIYMLGEEIERVAGPDRLAAADAQNLLTSLLRTVRNEAERRGAASPSPSVPVADLADVRLENGTVIRADAQAAELVRMMTGRNEHVALVAVSLWNAFAGETVPIQVKLYPNPVAFRAGELVAETRIDGRMSEDAILSKISDFLQTDVRNEAASHKMIGAAGRDLQFGEVTNDVILSLVKQIKDTTRVIRVQALASQDTRAADRLRLEFRLR